MAFMCWSMFWYSCTAARTSCPTTSDHSMSRLLSLSCVRSAEVRREEQKVRAVTTLSCCATLGGVGWEVKWCRPTLFTGSEQVLLQGTHSTGVK